jgi:uroporphyrinogen-III synthase
VATAILTRDAAGARPYGEALAPLGLTAVALPVTSTADVDADDQAALTEAVRQPWDGVLVASARAAAPLARALAGAPLRARVMAVGAATAAALARHGIAADTADGDGSTAAAHLVAAGCRSVLVPRAAGGRDEAIEHLRRAGARVLAVPVYRTVIAPADDPALVPGLALIAAGSADVVALFAPSQVGALAALLAGRGIALADGLASSIVAAIGATTAAALDEHGVRAHAVAARPEPAAMAQAVGAVYPRGR